MTFASGAVVLGIVAALIAPRQAPRTAVLVELFTSEGCSSCPPADALLAALRREQPVDGAEIVVLSLHVDYWDRLGWKDPFSSKLFTARQQEYGKTFGEDRVYTPQMVVDGRDEFNGADRGHAERAVRAAVGRARLPLKVTSRVTGDTARLTIDLPSAPANPTEPVDVLVALAEDDLTSNVRRGENTGRTLTHTAVVRKLERTGVLDGEAFVAEGSYRLDRAWKPGAMHAVVWLQGRKTRHVYAAASTPLGAAAAR